MTDCGSDKKLPPISEANLDDGSGSGPSLPAIDGYEVNELLAEGGMGTVWRAVQLSTRRPVALKLLGRGAFGSEKARARFQREVELSARLEHPNIARIYDSGLHHGMYYYVMELMAGVPLDEHVKECRLTQRQILGLMRTICEAIGHAHQRGVIHRDLKPSNILVTSDGQPHILDFGLAKTFPEGDSKPTSVTTDGETVGTPAYMAPEQIRGREADRRSDIFSLGVIWYELLADRPPFEGNTRAEILSAILTKEPISIDLLSDEVSSDLRRVVHKCLCKDPDLRYQDVDDLLVDVKLLQSAWDSRESVAMKKRKSVAVLPFLNLSKDSSDEYFCEAITEDITTNLLKIEGLAVASCWSVRSYQVIGLDVRGVGRELGDPIPLP